MPREIGNEKRAWGFQSARTSVRPKRGPKPTSQYQAIHWNGDGCGP
jgi:hypothetical protein